MLEGVFRLFDQMEKKPWSSSRFNTLMNNEIWNKCELSYWMIWSFWSNHQEWTREKIDLTKNKQKRQDALTNSPSRHMRACTCERKWMVCPYRQHSKVTRFLFFRQDMWNVKPLTYLCIHIFSRFIYWS